MWQHQVLSVTYVLDREQQGQKNWEVRILASVVAKIRHEANLYVPSENGGTLYGIVNPLMHRITVTRAEEAPQDSKRESDRFVHGTEGLRERVKEIEQRSKDLIGLLGTWHSHPRGGGPSPTDRSTADTFAQLREAGPFLMLIVLPNGALKALIEER